MNKLIISLLFLNIKLITMKRSIIIFICLLLLPNLLYSSPIKFEKAKDVAVSWKNIKAHLDNSSILDYTIAKDNDTILYYVFNFAEGGFVITSADTKIVPILAYSYSGYFKDDSTSYHGEPILKHYKSIIKCLLKNKTSEIKTQAAWDKIDNSKVNNSKSAIQSAPQSISQTVTQSVAPLLETTQSSRWAYWYPYSVYLPNYYGGVSCVPIAISQICKYYRYPYTGTGTSSNSYMYNGTTYNFFVDFSKQLYDYTQMPFRLTYCGNPAVPGNCTDPSFDIVPGVTQDQINEVGKLIYQFGIMVQTNFSEGGTYGSSDLWAAEMHDHLGYNNDYVYWSSTSIANDPTGFKNALRNDLDNTRVVLYNLPGHEVVIDGYETEYFHMAYGNGGAYDAFYYIYASDEDGIHVPRLNPWGAIVNLHPNCNWPYSLNVVGTTNLTDVLCYQANSSIVVSNYVLNGNGTTGANAMIVSNEITLNSEVEIKLGASLTIINGSCNY